VQIWTEAMPAGQRPSGQFFKQATRRAVRTLNRG
jgi:hypothetical protein